jgi:hypothetical protein
VIAVDILGGADSSCSVIRPGLNLAAPSNVAWMNEARRSNEVASNEMSPRNRVSSNRTPPAKCTFANVVSPMNVACENAARRANATPFRSVFSNVPPRRTSSSNRHSDSWR